MKLIELLSDKISEEIQDAKSYALMAMQQRDAHEDLARTLHELAEEEIGHMRRLHTQVKALIDSYKKEHGEPPADMMAVYNYLHEKQVATAAEAQSAIDMFK